jgi:hypothetical protein
MRVVVQCMLRCRAESAWDEVVTSRLLVEVAAPLIAIRPAAGEKLPDRWLAGCTVQVSSYLFGVIPLAARNVHFERIDPMAGEIQTREADAVVRRWDHLIRIRPAANGCCEYRDQIDIEAGWLTAGVWLFAHWFYRHRQRRWKAVARRLAACRTARRNGMEMERPVPDK